jgi:tRNA(fMet)-specific endonuclease VapC
MTLISRALIDSDILSLYLKQDQPVEKNALDYIYAVGPFTFSIITAFEISRGMKARGAFVQLRDFEKLCSVSDVVNLNNDVISIAGDIYSQLHNSGQIVGDADILIAATALHLDLPVVTNNEKHFRRINGLRVLNWNK